MHRRRLLTAWRCICVLACIALFTLSLTGGLSQAVAESLPVTAESSDDGASAVLGSDGPTSENATESPQVDASDQSPSATEGDEADDPAIVDANDAAAQHVESVTPAKETAIAYSAHVASIGWQDALRDGATAGTTGCSLSIEALKVTLENPAVAGSVQVRAHVSNVGWQDWTSGTAGTTGRSLSMEALQVRLTGEMAASYDVYYRAHVSGIGWMGWAKDGEEAGTQGYSSALEAVQILLVEKGGEAPSSSGSVTSEAFRRKPVGVSVGAHVSGIGWMAAVCDGATAGTTGRSLSLEALREIGRASCRERV